MSAEFKPNAEGIFFDLPEDVYRAAPGVNISSLKAMSNSPLHFWQKAYGPKEESTPAQVFGSIFHRAILEPGRNAGFKVKPDDINLRTKEGQAWRGAQTEPIITMDDALQISSAIVAIKKHALANAILTSKEARKEVSIFKIHEPTGLLAKGRLDILTTDSDGSTVCLDLKTTQDASPTGFPREMARYNYHQQSAWYLDLCGGAFFTFIAIEKTAPYGIGLYNLDHESIEIGRQKNEENMARLKQCLDANKWPGYPEEITTISLPAWAKRIAGE
jgi:exodeoxyribonuclease VIII